MKTHMHRLIPELDDNGNFNGSSLMYCLQVYYSFKPNTIAAKGKDIITKLSFTEDIDKVATWFKTPPEYYDFVKPRLG
jgi:hypothetical protein